jgi:D-inositol-3-phosphate glycosyltransferase
MKKRIGIIMYQTSNSKGQELVAQRMTRDFNKLAQRAYLITSVFHDGKEVVPPESLAKRGYVFADDKVLNIPVIRVDSHVAKWPPRRIVFRDFIHTLERMVDEFELNVLITHSTLWNGPEDVAKFVAWRRDMRNLGGYQDPIVFCHMSHFQEPSSQRYSLTELTFRTAWNRLSLSKILETANLIPVITPFSKMAMVKMGAKPEKCFLFPGGVDDEAFLRFAVVDTTDFLKRRNINADAKIVSYLGSIEERKNPTAVLEVAERLKERPDIHFVLAGKGGTPYAEELERTARSLPNATYLGEIDESEKVALIKTSYLNILMSRLEGLGIAQLEFMYCGVPVITSAVGGQSWVVQDGIDGLHVKGPEDIAGAASAIVRLIEDENSYKQMSSNAREKAGKLSISKLIAELDAAIDTEMIRESGLAEIPPEVQTTLVTPEHALKTWEAGTWGIVATNKRVFIRQGLLSRKVTEIRYADIKSIEHTRRYAWGTLLIGVIISILFLIAPSLRPLLSSDFTAQIDTWWHSITTSIPPWFTSNIFVHFLFPLLPLFISMIIFLLQARSGFKLHVIGIKPLYVPRKFREAIGFIREKIDSLVS